MNKILFLLLASACLPGDLKAEDSEGAPQDTVVLEAESAASVQLPFRAAADKECNGETCLAVPQGAGKPPEILGRVRFTTRLARKAEYKLWIRAKWTDYEGNSIGLSLPNREPETLGQGGIYDRWHWVPGPVVNFEEGNLTFYLFNREDGIFIDRILLVPDATYIPRGKEGLLVPAGWAAQDFYFADDFSRSTEQPVKQWNELSGKWGINYTLDPNKLPNFFSYSGNSEQQGLSITGRRFWRDYYFEAAINPEGCQAAGLVFSLVDDKHYLLVRWTKEDKLELCRVSGGTETIIKTVPLVRLDNAWWRMGVETWSDRVTVTLDGRKVLESQMTVSGGKVGLLVSGGTAVFDNVEVSPVRRFVGGPTEQAALWEIKKGKFEQNKGNTFSGQGKPAIALTGKPDWSNYTLRVSVKQARSTFGIFTCWSSPEDYYLFESSGGEVSIIKMTAGQRSVLASVKATATADWVEYAFKRVGAYLAVESGDQLLLEAWDDTHASGRPGIMSSAAISKVTFQNFEVDFEERESFHKTIESVSFLTAKIVDPTDVPDLTEEQFQKTTSSDKASVLMRRPKYYQMVGTDRSNCLWWHSDGVWQVNNEKLLVQPTPTGSAIFCNRHAPNDSAVKASFIFSKLTGDLGVILHGVREDPSLGYRLVLEGKDERHLNLYNARERVDSVVVKDLPEESTMELWRSGDHILGWLNGKLLLQHKDSANPEGEEVGLFAARYGGEFVSVNIVSLNYRGMKRAYLFEKPEADWLPVGGTFEVHGGISCLRSSHWLAMRGQESPALMWHKSKLSGNSSISYQAMEHSVWNGWNLSPSHIHTAYINMGMTLCADGQDVRSGYTCIINGWNLQRSVLLRDGKVVASLAHDKNFPVQWVGSHAPLTPRTSVVRMTLTDGEVVARVNGIPVLRYKDPNPLKEGWAGVWCWDAKINVGDLHISAEEFSPLSLDELKSSRDAGNGSVAPLIQGLK
ncbi:MAG: hypothetical protein O3B01_25145 [Planctomycetota bacterium]|nr:hypothetical protein [Planctomycetota bacterium]